MTTMAETARRVTGGADTHRDQHVAVERVGVEGTGTYGAGLTRYLHAEDVAAVEVNRPRVELRPVAAE